MPGRFGYRRIKREHGIGESALYKLATLLLKLKIGPTSYPSSDFLKYSVRHYKDLSKT